MQVHFRFFAGCREAVGVGGVSATLDDAASVADARQWLQTQYPALRRLLPTVRFAVDREFADEDTVLVDGTEVALIPPVSGGSGERARLSHEPIARDAAMELVSTDGAGGIATFAGVVRPTSKQGRAVDTLDYEAYEPMAVAKLEQCLSEAHAQWPILDAAVVHRLGHLELGEVAVSIGVAARHRKEAFAACAFVIDRIKEIVPIWKKETGPDGAEWVSEGA